ncbi:MAG: hypothetical protein R3E68_02265 [Burkholderiaceae bacterium]
MPMPGPDPLIGRVGKVGATIGKVPLGVSRLHEWYFWLWNQDIAPPADYARFKARLYQHFDPRFAFYFRTGRPAPESGWTRSAGAACARMAFRHSANRRCSPLPGGRLPRR